MPFTYVIADLHGRYDLLSEAVTKIVEHSKSDRPATIVTLGDYVDRGPKSRQVIERLMDWGSPDLKLVCLKGNHEDIMWQCCRQPIKAGWWIDNGGGATLISYGQNYGDIVNVKIVPEQHLRWIEELPLMHVDRHRVYVHAGVDPDLPLAAQSGPAVVEDLQGPRSARSWNATCRARASPIQGWSSLDRRSDKPRYTSLVYRPAGNRRLR